ncbi:VOC family protein [Acidaminobacter sp. JC074]|uniref:VOC family protein n=1 Tax=Acidaminobacter sp. JC074 TaxID=2530199 RepID=UPI001F0E684F|nr:VOC family protein [Acidaminobacter sp. JC074]MCH4888274.1 VOC family protein [Acidaminobacter sp. JC074]
MKVSGINISSKQAKALAEFYTSIGVGVFVDGDTYDGWTLGEKETDDRISIWVWDENKWGPSNSGFVTIVLSTDDIDGEYEKLKKVIPNIEPPFRAAWGGMELKIQDPDGNKILIL